MRLCPLGISNDHPCKIGVQSIVTSLGHRSKNSINFKFFVVFFMLYNTKDLEMHCLWCFIHWYSTIQEAKDFQWKRRALIKTFQVEKSSFMQKGIYLCFQISYGPFDMLMGQSKSYENGLQNAIPKLRMSCHKQTQCVFICDIDNWCTIACTYYNRCESLDSLKNQLTFTSCGLNLKEIA